MRINQLVNYDKYRLKLLETYKDVFDSNNVTLKYSDYENRHIQSIALSKGSTVKAKIFNITIAPIIIAYNFF